MLFSCRRLGQSGIPGVRRFGDREDWMWRLENPQQHRDSPRCYRASGSQSGEHVTLSDPQPEDTGISQVPAFPGLLESTESESHDEPLVSVMSQLLEFQGPGKENQEGLSAASLCPRG